MNKAIEQILHFDNISSRELFELFTDANKHAEITRGAKTSISALEGSSFSLLNGNLKGKNLRIVPNRMIVQSWRGNVWRDDDLDSILTLVFNDTPKGCKLHMVHAFTPDQFDERWEEVYWQPIRKYLKNK